MLPLFRSISRLAVHPIPTFAPPPLSLIHTEDLVRLMLLAADKGTRIAEKPRHADRRSRPAGYYFAAAAEYPNYADIGRMVARVFGRQRVVLLHMAEPLPWLAAGVSELVARLRRRPNTVNVDKMREATMPSWASSPQAALDDLDFSPAHTLQERLRQTADWYRQHDWL